MTAVILSKVFQSPCVDASLLMNVLPMGLRESSWKMTRKPIKNEEGLPWFLGQHVFFFFFLPAVTPKLLMWNICWEKLVVNIWWLGFSSADILTWWPSLEVYEVAFPANLEKIINLQNVTASLPRLELLACHCTSPTLSSDASAIALWFHHHLCTDPGPFGNQRLHSTWGLRKG